MELKETSIKYALKVLIVDDDDELRQFMRMKLAVEAPYLFFTGVEGGPECLEYLKTNPVDCIISDYQMPGMNGMELLLALREAGNDVPFIFVTGQGNEEVAREAFTNGANDYFTKEFGFAHFARIINSVEQAVRRRDAEHAVKEREFWINESQRVARIGSYVLDIKTGMWTSSEILNNIFGIDNDYDKSVEGWVAIVYSGDRDRMVKHFAEVLEKKKRFEADYRIARKNDGQVRWVSGLGELVLDRDGNPVKMLGTIQDITERKRVEDALLASQKYLQTIIDTEPECVKLLSLDGKLMMINRAGLAMIEADSLEQVWGTPVYGLIVPEHREPFKALGEKVRQGGTGTLEFDVVGFKGTRRRLETHAVPLRNEKDEIIALLGITRDITERKKVEEALEESRSAFQALAENLPGIVYRIYLREKGRMRFLNRAAESITGYTDEELGRGEVCQLETLILHEDLQPVVEEVKSAIVENRPFMVEYRLKHKDGSIRYMLEQGKPIHDQNEEPLYVDGVIFDVTERRRAGEALKEKERALTALIDANPEVVLLLDSEGVQLAANAAAASRFGCSRDELVGRSAFDFLPPGLAVSRKVHLDEVFRTGRAVRFEDTRDGRVIESYVNPVIEADGHVSSAAIVGIDVTERKKVEEDLRASQNYLQTIIDTEPECVKLLASDGTLMMMNRAGLDVLEADSLEQVKGASVVDLVVPEYREAFNTLGERVFKGGSGTLEFDMVGLKGRRIRLETHAVPLRDERDEVIALLGITRDITERGKAEEALKFKNALLLAQQEVSLDGIFMVDENDEIISFNKRFAEMWRIPPEVMATGSAERARLYVAPNLKDPEWFLRRLRSVYENRTEKSMDEIELKDGRTFVRYSDSIFGADGRYYGRVLYFSDITQRKVLERQRADFYAMVTHDLNAPLATILGYLELIANAAQGSEGGDIIGEMTKAVRRSGDKLLKLADDFMAAARLESGVVEVRTMPVEVAGLLLEVRDDFEPISVKKGIAFRADISGGLPLAVLDKKQVERAVSNLLQNAFNYTPKGGEVTLKAETALRGVDKYIMISVSDTGPGIPYDEREKIFNKYYRLPKTAGTKGTGLGLAIVKAVAEAHGGRVEVESEEGLGSTFRLILPTGV